MSNKAGKTEYALIEDLLKILMVLFTDEDFIMFHWLDFHVLLPEIP